MTVDGEKLYDPTLTEYALENPHLDLEVNRFGTLSFTIYEQNPRYQSIHNVRSIIRLYRDGVIRGIFRPVQSRITFRGGIEYTCEELTACLNDIMRRPADMLDKTAREIIELSLAEADMIASNGEMLRPSLEYLKGILVQDGNELVFPNLTASSPIGLRGDITTAYGTYPPTHWGYDVVGTNMSSAAVADLSKALFVLGYGGKTYMPADRGYPSDALTNFLRAHGIEVWANDVDIQTGRVWQSLYKPPRLNVFELLLDEMRTFVRQLPDTESEWDSEWDRQTDGLPITFSVGLTPASDTLDNGDAEYKVRKAKLNVVTGATSTTTITLTKSSRSLASFNITGITDGRCLITLGGNTYNYNSDGKKTPSLAYLAPNTANSVTVTNSGNTNAITCEILYEDEEGDMTLLSFGKDDIDYVGYWDFLQENIIDNFGGYLVPVWSENGCAINYVRDEDLSVSSQNIRFGENMVDMFIDADCAEAYSTIIPVGKDGITIETVHPYEQDFLTDDAAYRLYGRREIVKTWEDISSPLALYNAAMDWMLTKSLVLKDKITVTAIDMKYAGVDTDYLNFMEQVPIINDRLGIDDRLPLKAASIALDSPMANTYGLSNEPENLFDESAKQYKATDQLSYLERMIKRGVFKRQGGKAADDEEENSGGGIEYNE